MKTFDEFLPYILPFVPGCPTPTAYQELRNSAIEFCEQTTVIQVTSEVPSVSLQSAYTFPAQTEQQPCRLLEAFYGKRELGIAPTDQVGDSPALVGDAGTGEQTFGDPVAAFLRAPAAAQIAVAPVPKTPLSSAYFVFRVALRPTRAATSLADELFDNWVVPVAAGAIARLRGYPGQMFTGDASMAMGTFSRGMAEARIEARKARVRAGMRVQPAAFVARGYRR